MPHYQILLADDDQDDCLLFKDAISDLAINATIQVVNDGAELMNYFRDNTRLLPDVLFLDLNMPRKSGMECLKELKSDAALKEIPVIVYSTSLVPEVLNELYIGEADFCLVKPPDFGELKYVIGKAFEMAVSKKDKRSNRDAFLVQP